MPPFAFEPLEQRTFYSADSVGFPAWSATMPGSICYEEWPGVTSEPAGAATRTGPLTLDGKLASFHGLQGVDPATLTATIHWGDLRGGHAGTIVVNGDGTVDVFGAYTYAEAPEYPISIQLSGGYQLLRVDEGPRFMDWNLWDPGPTATYRHLYQHASLPAGVDGTWVAPIVNEPTPEPPPQTGAPAGAAEVPVPVSAVPAAAALDVLQPDVSEAFAADWVA